MSKRKHARVVFQHEFFGFVYFYDDGDWKLKVERQESLMDVLAAALCPGWSLMLAVE